MNLKQLQQINHTINQLKTPFGFRQTAVLASTTNDRHLDTIPADHVPKYNQVCLRRLFQTIDSTDNLEKIADALSMFWIVFNSIRPFEHGNDRTAKQVINLVLECRNLRIESFDQIDRTEIAGDIDKNAQIFKTVFLESLVTKGEQKIAHNE
jgi:Fic family protein